MSGWFHRWALIGGLVGGLALSVFMLYQIPQYSTDLRSVVRPHFGGSSYPLSLLGLHTTVTVYVGLITMLANLAVVVVLTVLFKAIRVPAGIDLTRREDYVADVDNGALDRLDQLLDGDVPVTGAHALR